MSYLLTGSQLAAGGLRLSCPAATAGSNSSPPAAHRPSSGLALIATTGAQLTPGQGDGPPYSCCLLTLCIPPLVLAAEAIEVDGVACHHTVDLRLRNPGKILGDLFPRIGKCPLRMRIVCSPHQAIDTQQFPRENPRTVILEGCPKLPTKVDTRRLVEPGLHPAVVIRPPVVHEAQHRGDPANPALGNHKAQLGIPL